MILRNIDVNTALTAVMSYKPVFFMSRMVVDFNETTKKKNLIGSSTVWNTIRINNS